MSVPGDEGIIYIYRQQKKEKNLGGEKSSYKHKEAILDSALACDATEKVIRCPYSWNTKSGEMAREAWPLARSASSMPAVTRCGDEFMVVLSLNNKSMQ